MSKFILANIILHKKYIFKLSHFLTKKSATVEGIKIEGWIIDERDHENSQVSKYGSLR
jgi:hypothetical protein